ncbi:transcriptional coactivator/pterin dehydratase [Stanieria cyanosphaera PCC 7437]|uniref:4a-hydroxytetrahydrobiopterin dehydratase n=1 Tax=Stanieria cyanosphaera (strain ATCC 29371 / PCC 7437) TaxID=111780 RepID=K9XXL2_STAC7|nr:4a-hydroxytetrahydrobiopterin dehydratase [Stanieria cyanosphaera]AFZ36402.1 transcriptional coactivator/pterin dehydratase [Stanieria cyanosphaera PCC 7437]
MFKVKRKSQVTSKTILFNQQTNIVDSKNQVALKTLSSKELKLALAQLKGWQLQEGKLHRRFCFSSFEKALGFMSGLALSAKKIEHHLEESELYNCVTVDLITPEIGGITDLDVQLAQQANRLASILKAFY